MTLTERYKHMMLRLGYDPELRAGSMTPYDVGQIIVACIEEERQEAVSLEHRRREEERRLAAERNAASLSTYERYYQELHGGSPFRWRDGGGPTR